MTSLNTKTYVKDFFQTGGAKLIWIVCVCLGFFGSAILIKASYNKWQESPIETTITTFPLNDLDFPQVAVCPPKGSNSALNYDLMKANKISFSTELRENFKNFVWKNLVSDQHMIYVQDMLSMVSATDIQNMYYGQQSLPKPYGSSAGYKITFETVSGTAQTPKFGQPRCEKEFTLIRDLHFVLDLRNPTWSLSNWSVEVQLETDLDSGTEKVEIRKGPQYALFTIRKTWKDAEAQCQKVGGHLASIRNQEEQTEVEKVLGSSESTKVWIGLKQRRNEVYEWNDGSEMNFTKWGNTHWKPCGYMRYGSWFSSSCTSSYRNRYLCQLAPDTITMKQNTTYEFRKQNLVESQLSVSYKSKGNLGNRNQTTGLRMKWFLKDGSGERINNTKQPSPINSNLGTMIKLAARARMENLSEECTFIKCVPSMRALHVWGGGGGCGLCGSMRICALCISDVGYPHIFVFSA